MRTKRLAGVLLTIVLLLVSGVCTSASEYWKGTWSDPGHTNYVPYNSEGTFYEGYSIFFDNGSGDCWGTCYPNIPSGGCGHTAPAYPNEDIVDCYPELDSEGVPIPGNTELWGEYSAIVWYWFTSTDPYCVGTEDKRLYQIIDRCGHGCDPFLPTTGSYEHDVIGQTSVTPMKGKQYLLGNMALCGHVSDEWTLVGPGVLANNDFIQY